jgi:hypothetical protein
VTDPTDAKPQRESGATLFSRAVDRWPFWGGILLGVYLLIYGNTLGLIVGGAIIVGDLLLLVPWSRDRLTAWQPGVTGHVFFAILGVVFAGFGIYGVVTGQRLLFAALTVLLGASLVRDAYVRLKARRRQL